MNDSKPVVMLKLMRKDHTGGWTSENMPMLSLPITHPLPMIGDQVARAETWRVLDRVFDYIDADRLDVKLLVEKA